MTGRALRDRVAALEARGLRLDSVNERWGPEALAAALRAYDEEIDRAFEEAWSAIEDALAGLETAALLGFLDDDDANRRGLERLWQAAEIARDDYEWRVKRARTTKFASPISLKTGEAMTTPARMVRARTYDHDRNNAMSNVIAKPDTNPFAEYASAIAARRLDGKLLKFNKGDWLAEGGLVPEGTQLVALMDTLMVGWQKWQQQRPVDTRMGLLVDGFKPLRRHELGDENSSTWERDARGDLRDPWQFINNLVLVAPDDDEIFTYSTGSRGGIDAIGKLCAAHGKAPAGVYPLVCLAVGSYQHRDRTIGRVKYPILEVVGTVEAAPFDDALARSRGEPALSDMRRKPEALPTAFGLDGAYGGHDPEEDIPI
jgi:hypothetical protein